MRITEIIERTLAFHPELEEDTGTDTVKYGDPDKECTGIALTGWPSVDVIREAASLGCNLVITHEPSFYTHPDKTDWLDGNKVFLAKKQLLDETGMVIWRHHDHIHGGRPPEGSQITDWIFYGIMQELGWEDYVTDNPRRPLQYELPETTVREIAEELMDKMNLNGVRVVGDLDAKVSKVLIGKHLFGGDADSDKIKKVDAEDIDVVIPLEMIDWSVSEYIVDSGQLGHPRAIISVGHFNIEEPGMKYFTTVLPDLIDHAVPVHFIQSGDTFSYISRDGSR